MKGLVKIYQKVFANVSTLDQIFLHVYKIKAMRNDKTVRLPVTSKNIPPTIPTCYPKQK
jgi:hypothetical protein